MSERIKLSTGLHPEAPPPADRPGYGANPVIDRLARASYEEAQTTRASLHDLIESGKLGRVRPDLDIGSVPAQPSRQPSMELDFGSASPTVQKMVLAERQARAKRGIVDAPLEGETAVRRRLATDGGVDIDAANAAFDAANPNHVSFTAQNEAYMKEKAARDAADEARLASLPPDFVATGVERYGRDGLISILNAEQTLGGYKGPETGEPTLTHASTGEQVSLGDAQERIETDRTRRMGDQINRVADTAHLQGLEHASLINMGGTELTAYETALSPDVKLTAISDPLEPGKLGIVELTVTTPQEDGTEESHDVAVTDPGEAPAVFIDGHPAMTPDEEALAEAVIAEAERITREAAEAETSETTENSTEQAQDSEPQAEVIETAPEPVVEPEKPAEPARTEAPAQSAERQRPTPEARPNDMVRAAGQFASNYLRNPMTRQLLEQMGLNTQALGEKLRTGKVTVSPETMAKMMALHKEVTPGSGIWDYTPGHSTGQRAADEARRRLKAILDEL